MQKVILIVVGSIAMGAVAVAGIQLTSAGKGDRALREVAQDVSLLRSALSDTREEIASLDGKIRRLASDQAVLAAGLEGSSGAPLPAVAVEGEEGDASPSAAILAGNDQLKAFVFAAIDEERRLREEEREKQREEMRQQFEQRRQEIAALSEGPYERYNLKVNSLAKVLEMSDAQKQAYFALSQKYGEKMDEGRRQLEQARRQAREQAAAAGQTGEGQNQEGGRGPGRGRGGDRAGGEAYRQLAENLQKEFTTELEGVFTAYQLETYSQLPPQSQSFQNTGYIAAPGEENTFGGMFGGRMGGAAAGGPQVQFGAGARGNRGGGFGGGGRGR